MQQRPSPRRLSRFLTPATTLTLATLALAGCSASGTSSAGGGTGGSGNPGSGGNGNPGTGGGGVSTGSGGGGTPTATGGTGTPAGTGGAGNPSGTGGGGTPSGTGGTGTPGGTGGTGSPGSGGSGTPGGTGGTGTAASGGAGGGPARTCPSTNPDMISDFEEGSGVMIKQGTPPRTGTWYDYNDKLGTQTPAAASTSLVGIAAEASGDTAMCNKWAMHVVGKGLTMYSGFGATFTPTPTAAEASLAAPYDVSAYTGVSFKIKSGSGTPAAVYFGFKTKETAPTGDGGFLTNDDKGPSNDTHIGLRNNRGHMLVPPWIPNAISTTWQTITIPFGTLIPRWVPATGANACPAAGAGVAKCQAPAFNAANILALEFSVLPDPGFPKPAGSTPGTYDIWVDDVALVKGDMGLDPGGPADTAGVGSCTKPTGPAVGGKYLVSAYNQWKQNFVVNGTVVRPENGNDTVSEGIAYGMLIAVNMNDKTTFDTLYSYWKSHASAGTLMTWCLPNGGNSCNAMGGGSATDADEDAAFALLQAGKVWAGGTYTAEAKSMIADIWSKDIDPTSHLPTGGSNYGSTSSKPTNPSYFAPSHYRAFKAAGDTNNWDAVISAVYGVINGSMGGANGLFPAWCSGNCTAVASNGGMNDTIYQYDAHRIPMRIGMDYCWNGTTAAAAQTYANKIAGFFATNPAAGLNGIGRIFDLYSLNGNAASGGGPNSASIIGTAAVAAMASGQKTFLNDAYQGVFDMVTRGTLAPPGTAGTPYSYYNATVGMLTLLIMTGNFMH